MWLWTLGVAVGIFSGGGYYPWFLSIEWSLMHGAYCALPGFYKVPGAVYIYFYSNPGVLEHMQTKVPNLSATNFKVDLILTNTLAWRLTRSY